MTGLRVLVCGGRDYHDAGHIFETLDNLHSERGIVCVIEGGALGADEWAAMWAEMTETPRQRFKANWSLGRKAGPIRNQRMIDEGKPDLVVAFPGGRGTADMVKRAKAAGLDLIEVSP